MIWESPYTVTVPPVDVATYVFSCGTPESRRTKQYFDATCPSRSFSLDEAKGFVQRLGHGLQTKLQLGRNDKVLLYSNNDLYFPILLWGTIAAGCVFTAASPTAKCQELSYQLRDSEAKVLLTHPSLAQVALEAAAQVGIPKNRIFLFCDPIIDLTAFSGLGIEPWTEIWSSVEESKKWSWRKIDTIEESSSTTAIINYSSGTTGLPKGVEITHYNSVANSIQLSHKMSLFADTPKAQARKARLDQNGQRWLAALPMYHVMGQTWFCLNAVRLGVKVFVMPRYNVVDYLQYLDLYRITFMPTVPTILTSLIKQPHPSSFNLTSIEGVVCGAAPLNIEIAQIFTMRYLRPEAQVRQGLGMTECTCSVLGFALDDEDVGTSVGWLHANCRAKIAPLEDWNLSEAGPPGIVAGELWISGPNVMKGYFKKPDETAKSIVHEDGIRWLRTGDIAYFDAHGRCYVIDRLKELIKVNGIQVPPAELELALMAHPDIADAAVVGARFQGSEYPRAFVVRKRLSLTEKEVAYIVEQQFPRHKWLSGGVYFIDEIPRTASGKVQRRFLPKFQVRINAGSTKL